MTPDEILARSQWDTFWVPRDVRVVDRPELLFVSCPRDISYLNNVLRLQADDAALPAIFDEVLRAHAGRSSRAMIPPTVARPALDRALAAAGYSLDSRSRVAVIAPGRYAARDGAAGIAVERVRDADALRACYEVASAAFEMDLGEDEAQLASDLAQLQRAAPRVYRFLARDVNDGAAISTGGMTAFGELGFALLWGGSTVARARGRGAYSAVLAARLWLCEQLGLRLAGLYAHSETSAPIVARQGFDLFGTMCSWTRPAETTT